MSNGRTYSESSSRWYFPNGDPCFELPKKDGKGMKSPTLADARKLLLLPSVTTILKVLDKPALNDWKARQVAYAIMTTPQNKGETIDQFFDRVLLVERVHEQEAATARDIGTSIHDAIEKALGGKEYDQSLAAFVKPVVEWANATGKVLWTEKHLVGDGFAGRADMMLHNPSLNVRLLVDFKTTKSMPDKDSWTEHKLQTAAYASTPSESKGDRLVTCNVYISTKEPGNIAVFTQHDWADTYVNGFEPLLRYWMWANQYWPGKEGKK